MVVYEACIEAEPVTKKNSQQIYFNQRTKRHFITQSNKYKTYENLTTNFLSTKKPAEPINYAVNVQALFYRSTKRRVDLVNLQEALLDVLVRAGILEDDNFNIVASMDGSKVLIDRERPRTEIVISRRD